MVPRVREMANGQVIGGSRLWDGGAAGPLWVRCGGRARVVRTPDGVCRNPPATGRRSQCRRPTLPPVADRVRITVGVESHRCNLFSLRGEPTANRGGRSVWRAVRLGRVRDEDGTRAGRGPGEGRWRGERRPPSVLLPASAGQPLRPVTPSSSASAPASIPAPSSETSSRTPTSGVTDAQPSFTAPDVGLRGAPRPPRPRRRPLRQPRRLSVMAPPVVSIRRFVDMIDGSPRRTERMRPTRLRRPWRTPRSRSRGTAGVLRLSTVAGAGRAGISGTSRAASVTGVSHGTGSSPRRC